MGIFSDGGVVGQPVSAEGFADEEIGVLPGVVVEGQARLSGRQAVAVMEGVELSVMDEALAGRVRKVLAELLNGKNMDEASGLAGFEPSGFMALAVANESVMGGLVRVFRMRSMACAFKVLNLADLLADSPANVQGRRAAMQGYQWAATNGMPEALSRLGTRTERAEHIRAAEADASEKQSHSLQIETGVDD